jgi:hypothetical protein
VTRIVQTYRCQTPHELLLPSPGQTERVNQCLETILRCFIHTCPKQWSRWLPLAKYWYNTSFHSATGHSPFEVLYGYTPRHFGIQTADSCAVLELGTWLLEREVMTQVIKQHLLRAQTRMKVQADKKRLEITFVVSDIVFLKLQPNVQSSLAPRAHQKLSFWYFGPYSITEKIGSVAYHLDLPASSSVHQVFHVSQLKKLVSPGGEADVAQVLIKWSNMDEGLATWEDKQALHQQFPGAPA